jgi:hypothetical protein
MWLWPASERAMTAGNGAGAHMAQQEAPKAYDYNIRV